VALEEEMKIEMEVEILGYFGLCMFEVVVVVVKSVLHLFPAFQYNL
jgi:hypothetical protein